MDKRRVMLLVDRKTGLMKCRVCGQTHFADRVHGGKKFVKGSWRCGQGCIRSDSQIPKLVHADSVEADTFQAI